MTSEPYLQTSIEDLIDRLSVRQLAWCEVYAETHNATQAARDAGYAASHVHVQASQNLKNPKLRSVVRYFRNEIAAAVGIEKGELIKRWRDIAFSDPREVVNIIKACCRYCHGKDHAYQWRTEREFNNALNDWKQLPDAKRVLEPEPSDEGGYGYNRTNPTNPDCPECDGWGEMFLDVRPTKDLSPEGQVLFKGAYETAAGIKVLLEDRMKALEQLSKILGVYDQPDAGETASAFGKFIVQLQAQGSKPPLVSPHEVDTPASAVLPKRKK